MALMKESALILYAHGARDARWAEPFERLLRRVREKAPDLPAALAFLDYLEPTLMTAVQALVERGVRRVRIVPLFFGRGGHLREDFPRQLEEVASAHPDVAFEVTEAAGETEAIIDALAAFALGADMQR
jgi:sirohydrochlorin cobaltochelatase